MFSMIVALGNVMDKICGVIAHRNLNTNGLK